MGDVQVAFGLLIHCFMQWPSYLLWCTPPFSTFIKFLVFFYSSILQVFGRLLGLGSFDSQEWFLVHKQVFLPIAFSGINFMSITTIAPMSYLKSWAFVASIITVRFMVNQRPFLLEALTWVNNNTFFFQQHLKAPCDLLLPPTLCVLFSLWTIHRELMVWLQDSILECLHHIPFPTCSSTRYLKPFVFESFHVSVSK